MVCNFKVTTDRTVDATSLESIVREATALAGARTNDEKAIAIYEYLHNTIFHHAYPTEHAPQSVGPLKVINAYGWAQCGGQHTVLKALYETAGWKCRYLGWPGHTTVEVFYDGYWHYFDVFLKVYFWTKDKSHVASQGEIANDPSIVLDAVKDGRAARQHLCCGDLPADVVDGCKVHQVIGDSKGWAWVTWRDENYSPLVNLPCGAALRLGWKAEPDGYAVNDKLPQHSCGLKDFHNDRVLGPILEHYGPRNWSDGVFEYAPDFSKPGDVADVQLTNVTDHNGKLVAGGHGTAIFRLALPYPYVRTKLDVGFEGGDGMASLSTDAGTTWKPAALGDVSVQLKQKYDVWLKIDFSGTLSKVHFAALVEHNRSALPYLMPGKNRVTISTEGNVLPKDGQLSVTYVYQEASAQEPDRRTRFNGQALTYGEVKRFTEEVAALPYTFEIDVGGSTPPKMIELERAVRAK